MENCFKEMKTDDLYLIKEAIEMLYCRICDRIENHIKEGFALYDEKEKQKTFNWFNALTRDKKRLVSIRNCLQSEIDCRLEKEGGGDWVAM